VSKGLTRSRTDRLKVMQGGADRDMSSAAGGGLAGEAGRGGKVTAFSSAATRAEVSGSAALKSEPEAKLSPAQALEQQQWANADARAIAAEKRAEAKAKGYEGEACGECGNFTLVRNGTCLKCDTCGGTTGCS
jgi:ribonucleoside-diphosphate reductase alpha chain